MTEKEKRALFIGAAIAVTATAATAAAVIYLKKKKADDSRLLETTPLLTAGGEEECGEVVFNYEDNPELDFDSAYAVAVEAASKKFGSDPFVVSASDKKAIYETIGGERRACYSFGADDSSFMGGTPRGFLHVDAKTGEVFDSGSGDAEKID